MDVCVKKNPIPYPNTLNPHLGVVHNQLYVMQRLMRGTFGYWDQSPSLVLELSSTSRSVTKPAWMTMSLTSSVFKKG